MTTSNFQLPRHAPFHSLHLTFDDMSLSAGKLRSKASASIAAPLAWLNFSKPKRPERDLKKERVPIMREELDKALQKELGLSVKQIGWHIDLHAKACELSKTLVKEESEGTAAFDSVDDKKRAPGGTLLHTVALQLDRNAVAKKRIDDRTAQLGDKLVQAIALQFEAILPELNEHWHVCQPLKDTQPVNNLQSMQDALTKARDVCVRLNSLDQKLQATPQLAQQRQQCENLLSKLHIKLAQHCQSNTDDAIFHYTQAAIVRSENTEARAQALLWLMRLRNADTDAQWAQCQTDLDNSFNAELHLHKARKTDNPLRKSQEFIRASLYAKDTTQPQRDDALQAQILAEYMTQGLESPHACFASLNRLSLSQRERDIARKKYDVCEYEQRSALAKTLVPGRNRDVSLVLPRATFADPQCAVLVRHLLQLGKASSNPFMLKQLNRRLNTANLSPEQKGFAQLCELALKNPGKKSHVNGNLQDILDLAPDNPLLNSAVHCVKAHLSAFDEDPLDKNRNYVQLKAASIVIAENADSDLVAMAKLAMLKHLPESEQAAVLQDVQGNTHNRNILARVYALGAQHNLHPIAKLNRKGEDDDMRYDLLLRVLWLSTSHQSKAQASQELARLADTRLEECCARTGITDDEALLLEALQKPRALEKHPPQDLLEMRTLRKERDYFYQRAIDSSNAVADGESLHEPDAAQHHAPLALGKILLDWLTSTNTREAELTEQRLRTLAMTQQRLEKTKERLGDELKANSDLPPEQKARFASAQLLLAQLALHIVKRGLTLPNPRASNALKPKLLPGATPLQKKLHHHASAELLGAGHAAQQRRANAVQRNHSTPELLSPALPDIPGPVAQRLRAFNSVEASFDKFKDDAEKGKIICTSVQEKQAKQGWNDSRLAAARFWIDNENVIAPILRQATFEAQRQGQQHASGSKNAYAVFTEHDHPIKLLLALAKEVNADRPCATYNRVRDLIEVWLGKQGKRPVPPDVREELMQALELRDEYVFGKPIRPKDRTGKALRKTVQGQQMMRLVPAVNLPEQNTLLDNFDNSAVD